MAVYSLFAPTSSFKDEFLLDEEFDKFEPSATEGDSSEPKKFGPGDDLCWDEMEETGDDLILM